VSPGPILVTGATGFVGRRVVAALHARGLPVRAASRDPERARRHAPDVDWVRLDLGDPDSLRAALRGVRAAAFLVHLMADGDGYAERERVAARAFAAAAGEAGVERVVYLGGVEPQGPPSAHLQSRLDTGALLRAGPVPTVELRAGMIVGDGSESWRICRDLSARLPLMVLPRWMESRSCPVAIDDVVAALVGGLLLPLPEGRVFDLPGPEVLSAREILMRAARLRGMEPRTVAVPVLTPRLSSYWLKLVSGADFVVAQELVHGLVHDLLPTRPSFFELLPGHARLPFDAAVRAAMDQEDPPPWSVRLLEAVARRLAPLAR
jgi:uncharacterized protein YbjT (DUF2867 family)